MLGLDGYLGIILAGLKMTLSVGILAMMLALAIGVLGAFAKNSSNGLLVLVARFYTATIRGIPELILLLLVFYGLPTVIQDVAEGFGYELFIDFSPFVAGVLTIGFIYGAFATEVFHGAINAVPKGQIEAANAMGMPTKQMIRRIQLPQAIRFALPGLGNIWMLLIKATALISIIQLDDVMRAAKIAANATHKPFTAYLVAALLFLAITCVSIIIQKQLEKRYARGYA